VRHQPATALEVIAGVLRRRARPLADTVQRDELDDRDPHRPTSPSTSVASWAVTDPQPSTKPSCS
jgi:hypothetical protein